MTLGFIVSLLCFLAGTRCGIAGMFCKMLGCSSLCKNGLKGRVELLLLLPGEEGQMDVLSETFQPHSLGFFDTVGHQTA